MRQIAGRDRPSSDSYILDPLLLPRIEQFSYNHHQLDVDSVADYLRAHYREYRRKQQAPFRRLVLRAIRILQNRLAPRPEDRLRRREEEHSRRFREEQELPRSSSEDDVTSSGSDESTDQVEAGIGSDGVEKGSFMRFFEETDGRGGEAAIGSRRKFGQAPKDRRRKVKRRYGSDSGEEDELPAFRPGFNLLNSSLRTTYHGRPVLVCEKSDADVPAVVQSPCPVSVAVQESASKNSEQEPKRIQKSSKVVTPSTEAKQNQAFASPIAIAAAARAASVAGKKGSKQSVGSASSGKSPVLQQEGGEQELGLEVPLNGEGTIPSLKTVETRNTGKHRIAVKKQAPDTGSVSEQHNSPEHTTKTRKREKDNAVVKPSSSLKTSAEAVRFSDLGGIENVLGLIREITFPLYNPEIYPWLGLQPMGGILLHGPPGCGKTKLANAIAHETGLPFLKLSAPELVSGVSGESEAKVRGLFAEAARLAPCVVFIDEIDTIASKRENAQREMERRIVTQLMTCMDDLSKPFQRSSVESDECSPETKNISQPLQRSSMERDESMPLTKNRGHVLVIGATNRPEALDTALRRPGRFDREISLGVPDENGRAQILSVLAKHLRLEGSFDFKRIARCTPGFVGADLAALTREAGSIAIKRIVASRHPGFGSSTTIRSDAKVTSFDDEVAEGWSFQRAANESDHSSTESLENAVSGTSVGDGEWKVPWTQEEMQALSITMQDFEDAVPLVQPSTKREGFSVIPDVKWEDVGALSAVQKDLEFFISRRIKHPEDYEALGLDMDTGFLLYGPPGCGKTLVAKAVANDAQANFIYIKGPELLNKYVGESEHSVRVLFSRARSCAPCILFFDEMDALAPRRGTDGNAVAERVLNQLLSEMDGAEKRRGVFLIGATNRPDMIDPAILRPGRLGKLVYIPLPNKEGRLSILKTLSRRKPLSTNVDLASIAENESCEGLSGADLAALVNEACVAALQEKIVNVSMASPRESLEPVVVGNRHFGIALSQISPSVSKQDLMYYEDLSRKFNPKPGMKGIASGMFS